MIDAELLKLLTSMNQKIDTLYEMKEKVDSLYEMKEKVDSLHEIKEKVVSINERLYSLENIVTVMQYEHGRKLDFLLDYAKANMEKHDEYDKQFAYNFLIMIFVFPLLKILLIIRKSWKRRLLL